MREQNLSKIIGSDFAFVRSTNPHLQIQAPFPSLKVESIKNPCEKDSNQNENLESSEILGLSLRESGANEAIYIKKSFVVELYKDFRIFLGNRKPYKKF